ncbi:zinc ribbon domain-containing protein [Methylacidiphilum sp. Yel]|uniref:zinc ribbon domain-containing protein n=1 Tax=Methylacidiphilum sp. Yel TaxID=1847730 RepID=UPI0037427A19
MQTLGEGFRQTPQGQPQGEHPVCGHVGRENRPNKGLLFVCAHCGYTLQADLVAARNISMRTLFIWQDWVRTGR